MLPACQHRTASPTCANVEPTAASQPGMTSEAVGAEAKRQYIGGLLQRIGTALRAGRVRAAPCEEPRAQAVRTAPPLQQRQIGQHHQQRRLLRAAAAQTQQAAESTVLEATVEATVVLCDSTHRATPPEMGRRLVGLAGSAIASTAPRTRAAPDGALERDRRTSTRHSTIGSAPARRHFAVVERPKWKQRQLRAARV